MPNRIATSELTTLVDILHTVLENQSFSTPPELLVKTTISGLAIRLITRVNKLTYEGRNVSTFRLSVSENLALQCIPFYGQVSSFSGYQKSVMFKLLNPNLK
jgi:hypothetical protein